MTRSSESTPTPPAVISPASCRNTLGLFATGVTIITTLDSVTGQTRGMTANAFMSVSLDPPLVVISVRAQAQLHEHLQATGTYGVSLLSEPLEREARRFAGMPVAEHEPEPEFDVHSGVPVLRHAMAWVVARVVDAHRAGDHTLFIGEMVDLSPVAPSDQPPLAYFRSTFARVSPMNGQAPLPLEPWDQVDAWG